MYIIYTPIGSIHLDLSTYLPTSLFFPSYSSNFPSGIIFLLSEVHPSEFNMGLMMANSKICLKMSLFCLQSLKDVFAGYRILGWPLLLFSTLKIFFCWPLLFLVVKWVIRYKTLSFLWTRFNFFVVFCLFCLSFQY